MTSRTKPRVILGRMMATAVVGMAMAANAHAESRIFGNQFGKLQISNPTNTTITYQYRWGTGSVQSVTLSPGDAYNHWWEYARVNQNYSPRFFIGFDVDRTPGYASREYELPLYAVQDLTQTGRLYEFQITDVGQRWLDLRYLN